MSWVDSAGGFDLTENAAFHKQITAIHANDDILIPNLNLTLGSDLNSSGAKLVNQGILVDALKEAGAELRWTSMAAPMIRRVTSECG